MDFYAVLDQVLDLLRRRGRVAYRALQVQFHLDDAALAALKDELIAAQRLAVDEEGTVLVWTREPTPGPSAAPAQRPSCASGSERPRYGQTRLSACGRIERIWKTVPPGCVKYGSASGMAAYE